MSCFKVVLEGRCFGAGEEQNGDVLGFYATVGVVADTSQEFAREVQVALDMILKQNGLRSLNRPLCKSYCRVSEVYSVKKSSEIATLRGASFFHENASQIVLSILLWLYLSIFKPNELVQVSQ